MTSRVAIYARVSTPNQAQAQTIEHQLERLHVYVQSQGWSLADTHVFRDDGHSGARLDRPGLDRLRDLVKFGEVEKVLITSPDRLARNYVHQMVLLDELGRFGCEVVFLDRPMSDDPHDRLLLQIRSAVAEYERTLVTERMRRGRLAKYQAGTLLPWSKPPYGYRLHPDRPRDPAGVRVEESEAAVVRFIFAHYAEEKTSLCALAKVLQQRGIRSPSGKVIWSLATLRGILRQPAYTGKVYAHRFRYRAARVRRSATHAMGQPHQTAEATSPDSWVFVSTIPALVHLEQFEVVQAKLEKNQSFAMRNNKTHAYLLRALVSCGRCQAACTARALDRGKYRYYVCSGKGKPIHSRKLEKCDSRFAPAAQLDELVWQDLCDMLTQPDSIAHALERAHGGFWLPQELQARRQHLQQAQASLENQMTRLTDAYLASIIPLAEYQRRRSELEEKLTGLQHLQQQLVSQSEHRYYLAQLTNSVETFCLRVQQTLDVATFEQKRQLVELLVDRVVVNEEHVDIRYAIPLTPDSETIRFCHLRSDYRHHLYPDGQRVRLLGGHYGPSQPQGTLLAPLQQPGRALLHRGVAGRSTTLRAPRDLQFG